MSLISVRDVTKEYGEVRVLERVNLEIEQGDFCAVVGASGCGKTTFLRMLLSQEFPDRGAIFLDGKPLASEPGPDRGVVFQRYSVFPHLTVAENLIVARELRASKLVGRLFGTARRKALEDVDEMLIAVGLDRARNLYPKSLSGGMQQRLAIAQALLAEPKVLLLDEPFGALDPGTRADMHRIMLDLWRSRNMTIFMVTHDLKEGFRLGARLLVFDKPRWDPRAPDAFGATITYDLPLDHGSIATDAGLQDQEEEETDHAIQ